ncbi:AAA family ATPase [Methylocapsa sp. S129]|uniref:nSTAND1 domain-containing NTPase n=1 Tax=Methylocapsa sp. S129 TaxID=1641869 RepID=UPI00131E6F8D|nr:AAA family ATPase [Methylocapsa sp. S129]
MIVDRLAQDYARHFTLETYRWEYEPMLASGHFQDSIDPPSACDIVVLIVWSRLGTSLPARTAVREYSGLDGRTPVTGTEWEYEDALKAARERGTPDIIAFRKTSEVRLDAVDAEARARGNFQLDALDAFWKLRFADKGEFISGYKTYNTIEEFDALLEGSLRKLIERRVLALAAGPSPLARVKGSPFRGLRSYEFDDADIFHGRGALVAEAAERLAAHAREGTAFLLVAGPSGSGKSSLVKAALVPKLMKPRRVEGTSFLRRALFRPSANGGDIFLGLADALTRLEALPELLAPGQKAGGLAAHLRESVTAPGFVFAGALGLVTAREREAGRLLDFESVKLVLVVDQLEELFTSPDIPSADKTLFARLLRALARSGEVWIIATLRDDFWPQVAGVPELAELAGGLGRLDIASPSPAEIAEIIRKPALAAGLDFETHPLSGLGLDAVLAQDSSAEPGVLPLLSFTLDTIYAADVAKAGGTQLTFASYEALGGLRGAIAKRAETIVADLPEGAREAVPRVLRTLTTQGAKVAVARPAPLAAFPDASAPRLVVDALLAGRLLVAANEGGAPMLRLAHEALLTQWDRARGQLIKDRRDIETRTLVEAQERRWSAADPRGKPALLLRDPDLVGACDLARRWGDELPEHIAGFIALSARAARRSTVRRWTIVAAVMACLLALTAASLGALVIAQGQRDAALIAQSQGLIRDARAAVAAGDGMRGLRFALAALPRDLAHPDRPFLRDGAAALADAYVNRREIAQLGEGDGALHSVAFSPDGRRVLVASESGIARIWGLDGSSLALRASNSRLFAAAFSPDGARVVTASADGAARIWNAATGEAIGGPMIHSSDVVSASFSADGSLLVTGALDGVARLWDGRTGSPLGEGWAAGKDSPLTVAFSPDGLSVLTVSESGGARMWDVVTHKLIHPLSQAGETAEVAAFSPDGAQVIVGADNGVARLWDAKTGALLYAWIGYGAIAAVAFSPDGKRVATGAGDNSARIWNVETDVAEHILNGHSGPINALAFSPDGRGLATASEDHTTRLWDVETGSPIATLGAHGGAIEALAFSADGRLATASRDGIARLWSVEPLSLAAILPGGGGALESAGFSVDGATALVVSKAGSARLWNIADASPRGPALTGVASAALSPDGKLVVATSRDGPTRLYSADAGKVLATLRGKGDRSASFSSDSKTILVLPADSPPRLLDSANGADQGALAGLSGPADTAIVSRDGRTIFAAARGGAAGFWDAATREPRAKLEDYVASLESGDFSADGTRLVTASYDKTARLWDVATGKSAAPPLAHGGAVESAAFSADGTRVVTVSRDHTAAVWDAHSGARIASIAPGGNYTLWTAAFSPDGTRVVTASDDAAARLWDPATGEQIATFAGHRGPVTSAVFSHDGARLLTGSADGTARLWRTPPACQALIEAARAVTAPAADDLAPEPQSLLFRLYNRAAPLLAFLSPRVGETCR